PSDRGVVPGQFLDRGDIDRGRSLLAAGRTRQQQAQQPGIVQPLQQRSGNALRALDLVGSRRNLRAEFAGAGNRVGTGFCVHGPPWVGLPYLALVRIAADRSGGVNHLSARPPVETARSPLTLAVWLRRGYIDPARLLRASGAIYPRGLIDPSGNCPWPGPWIRSHGAHLLS